MRAGESGFKVTVRATHSRPPLHFAVPPECRRAARVCRDCRPAGIALGTGRHAAVSRAPCGEKGSITKTLTPNGPDRASSGPHGGCLAQSSALGDPQTSSCDLSSRWQVARTHTIGAEPRGRSGRVSGADQ